MRKSTCFYCTCISVMFALCLTACSKDLQQPRKDLSDGNQSISSHQSVNAPGATIVNFGRPKGYVGTGTLGDSTKATN